eukprot:CAMPEP_0204107592 /NCGR_PEP_ID=MMETSP0361-20130328/218_1 /ASSEMBLY_ACC=CAM_ASM_000343 /TAXON_ID=268821 /ORGANISM="Scrippsiella Hangoei, Strain SHTV-5" /LENGTH=182 /DNA_ID=CAMNT_0051057087 /DNA_START=14 /DNA_END=559 /DNA_ORIENTATION=+
MAEPELGDRRSGAASALARLGRVARHVAVLAPGLASSPLPQLPSGAEAAAAAAAAEASRCLTAAAKKGDEAGCSDALQQGADANWQDEDFFNYTALHLAAAAGHVEVCRLLRAAGAHVDPRSESDETPLLMAARAGKPAVCEFLLTEGADPKARTNYKVNARSAQEYMNDMWNELGAPTRCG